MSIMSVCFLLMPVDATHAELKCANVTRCDSRRQCVEVCRRGSLQLSEWYKFAWKTQNDLAKSASPCTAQLLGTHNSAITLADGYGGENDRYTQLFEELHLSPSFVRTHNQLLSLTDQLNMGVRMLELDVHWVWGDLRIAHCGGFKSRVLTGIVQALQSIVDKDGVEIDWDLATVGCFPSLSAIPAQDQRTFVDALGELADWLHANPEEFLLLYLDNESDLSKWDKAGLVVEAVEHLLGQWLFRPCDLLSVGGQWPTIQEIVSQRKRVVVFSRTNYNSTMNSTMFPKTSCQWHEPGADTLEKTCTAKGYVTGYDLVRPVGNDIRYGPLNGAGQMGPNKHPLHGPELQAWSRCGGMPAPDLLTPEIAENAIWGWRSGHMATDARSVVIQSAEDGRWISMDNTTMKLACRSEAGWVLALTRPMSTTWSLPQNGKENADLWDAALAAGVKDGVRLNAP